MSSSARAIGAMAELGGLGPGDHVCWSVASGPDYERMAGSCLSEGGRMGDKVFYFGPAGSLDRAPLPTGVAARDPHVAVLDGGPLDAGAMLAMFRREAATAAQEGYRALRVMADMDWAAGVADEAELMAFELQLDAVVADVGAIVVCAYRHDTYSARGVAGATAVHPLSLGDVPDDLGFRVWSSGADQWHVAGEVDCFNADVFGTALAAATAAAVSSGAADVQLDSLDFIDVAGMRAIAAVGRGRGDVHVRLAAASDTVARCWSLLGYDSLAPNVELPR